MPRSYRFGFAPLILAPILTFSAMCLYQTIKHLFDPEIGIWSSHLHTNLFVTLLVSLGAFFLFKYLEMKSLLAAIADSSGDAIIGISLEGKVLAWNRGAARIFGYSADEMIGKNISALVPADRPDDAVNVRKKIERSERLDRYETVRLRKDGTQIDVSLSVSPILNGSGRIIGASSVVRDITDKKRTEAALCESRERLAHAQAFSLTMVGHLGLDGRWLKAPVSFCEILGYSVEEMLELPFEAVTYPGDFDLERDYCSGLIAGKIKSVDFEKRCVTRRGEIVWVYVDYSTVTDSENRPVYFLVYLRDITKRKTAEEEVQRYHTHLEELVNSRTQALTEANDQLRKEITERRRAEKSLQESSEKLKFFAYSIVHDLKSPSVGIHGLTRRLHDCYGDVLDSRGKMYCEQILKASGHVAELIEKINIFIATKEAPLAIECINTKELLASLKNEFSERLCAHGIKWVEPETSVEIKADRTCILRVLRNFVDNALKYGGRNLSEIRLECSETKKFYILSVSDDGGSLETEDYEKLFELFQRTSSSRGVTGSGLGLAIVKETAERHRGLVWVEPEADCGKTFYLSISKELSH
ncbi:MAG: PAS domain S-box protein [Syntrophobacteraceae bacterium]